MVMKWKYHIPHVWESSEKRAIWEDVYLMPEGGSPEGKSYWFTLNAIGSPPAGLPDGGEWFQARDIVCERNLQYLGEREYLITDALDMLIKAEDFNRRELLEWAKVFIKEKLEDPEPVLVEGVFADFSGTNNHAGVIDMIAEALEAGVSEEDIIDYQQRSCEMFDD